MKEQLKATALVTGASRGVGKAIAIELAKRGFRIFLHYHRNQKAASDTLAELVGSGHILFNADLGDQKEIEALFENIHKETESLDVLVNNAAIALPHPIDMPDDQWINVFQKTIETNLIGPASIVKNSLHLLRKSTRAVIINISSRGAYRGEPEMPGYGASKAGLNSLTQSMAKVLGSEAISVFGIAPGFIDTEMADHLLSDDERKLVIAQSPLNRMATVDEIASLVGFLTTSNSAYMTGSIIDVNGASYFR